MASNKAKNAFYLLPLILGILGLSYQYNKNPESAFVVFLLFFFTGIAIVIFLNNVPFQPRERDYAYVGSFYAFAMWIGLGVLPIFDFLRKKIPSELSLGLTAIACLVLVPGIMAKEGWDDHDRSDRYTARDFAKNYLSSCAPNAVIFTNGDNDTFPLWYVQEVEGFRTDVRVINMSLLNTDWYITQMKNKVYESDPVPFKMEEEKYIQGTRDYLPIMDKNIQGFSDIKAVYDFIISEKPETKVKTQGGKALDYIPTTKIFVSVDKEKVLANGTVPPELADKIVDRLEFTISKSYILKNEMMILDLLANNNWDRPIYFAITAGTDNYMNLQRYFQIEGLAYRLVPVLDDSRDRGQTGRVNSKIMYDNLMNKFVWGGMDKGEIFMDENNLRMTMNFRNNFYRLASTLVEEGDTAKALAVLDKGMEVMPEHNVPLNYFSMPFAEMYLKLGKKEQARYIYNKLIDLYIDDLRYFSELEDVQASTITNDIEQRFQIIRQLLFQIGSKNEKELLENLKSKLDLINPNGARNKYYRANHEKYFSGVLENI
jgi:tetratricopeptide (TPR) repeat protein